MPGRLAPVGAWTVEDLQVRLERARSRPEPQTSATKVTTAFGTRPARRSAVMTASRSRAN